MVDLESKQRYPSVSGPTVRSDAQVALTAPEASVRLRAALDAGAHPAPHQVEVLVQRCGLEPDFVVRDMLTWALTRHDTSSTVPRLVVAAHSGQAQARSQAPAHAVEDRGSRGMGVDHDRAPDGR